MRALVGDQFPQWRSLPIILLPIRNRRRSSPIRAQSEFSIQNCGLAARNHQRGVDSSDDRRRAISWIMSIIHGIWRKIVADSMIGPLKRGRRHGGSLIVQHPSERRTGSWARWKLEHLHGASTMMVLALASGTTAPIERGRVRVLRDWTKPAMRDVAALRSLIWSEVLVPNLSVELAEQRDHPRLLAWGLLTASLQLRPCELSDGQSRSGGSDQG